MNEIASSHLARRTFVGNLYKQVKDPNLVGSLTGHKEVSKAFARYRDIDEDMKKDLVKLLEWKCTQIFSIIDRFIFWDKYILILNTLATKRITWYIEILIPFKGIKEQFDQKKQRNKDYKDLSNKTVSKVKQNIKSFSIGWMKNKNSKR